MLQHSNDIWHPLWFMRCKIVTLQMQEIYFFFKHLNQLSLFSVKSQIYQVKNSLQNAKNNVLQKFSCLLIAQIRNHN